jgi:hypothetical protein
MKIIKKGRKPGEWSKEFTCKGMGEETGRGCGAILLVEEEDVFQIYNPDYMRDYNPYAVFKCPECGIKTWCGQVPFIPIMKNLEGHSK